jgi:hypothetical protein
METALTPGNVFKLAAACLGASLLVVVTAQSPEPTIEIADYVAMPVTGAIGGTGQTNGMLARVNGFVEEPGGADRVFVNDLNGPLYILDKKSKQLATYLDFNGRNSRTGLFRRFTFEAGYANGLISLAFDPDYRRNGRFYTVHLEEPTVVTSAVPDSTRVPALSLSGYTTTSAIATPGEIQREAVLIEWTDSNPSNTTFEGSARELLRVQLNTRIHPLNALSFNPTARAGDAEWRVLYLGSGDGGSGESRQAMRLNPQRLDTLVGKILRIVPDLKEHVATSTVSDNGRYRIPNDNPFVNLPGARKEIWAYGFRNPHRLTWAIDDTNPQNTRLIANSIGLHTWETVNIVRRGDNYGYSLREGNQSLLIENKTTALPRPDRIPVRISEAPTAEEVTPHYPVIQYPHAARGGDAIGSGFLYRGKSLPALRGKYIFTDISTGRIWYADYKDMLGADDGKPETLAATHSVKIAWSPSPGAPKTVYDSISPIVEDAFHRRGGRAEHLPGAALVAANGRADAQLAVDASGELYILTKSDGMIRAVVGATIK